MQTGPRSIERAPAPPPSLVRVDDASPGIQRVRRGRGFAYRSSEGEWLRDAGELQRIRRLAIPPAYQDVWICPLPNGHIQATGRDARGRKQYRYHPAWSAARETDKFEQMAEFGRALPRLRSRVSRDLRGAPTLSREVLLAGLVRLLDTTLVRVGNEEYARSNGSYGLTTLRNPHAKVSGDHLHFHFKGKSGVQHDISIQDANLARIVRRCQQLPGRELFQYKDEDGALRRVLSADVNGYLSSIGGKHGSGFTAKDFRTWHASATALELTRQACERDPVRFNMKAVLAEVARRLGNTPAVCRRSYVHPKVLALWEDLRSRDADIVAKRRRELAELQAVSGSTGLRQQEKRLLKFL